MRNRGPEGTVCAALALALLAVGPAAAQDITGMIAGVDGQIAACRNADTSQTVTAPLGGGDSFDCTALGLSAGPGDGVLVASVGTASGGGGPGVAGRVGGLDTEFAVCRNLTTGGSVLIPLNGATEWSCTAAGLQGQVGDRVAQLVRGTVPGGGPLPECTITFDGSANCPAVQEVCGATATGGNGCVVAGLPFCYDTGLFALEVGAGDMATIEFSGDVNTLDVFFATGGTGEGTMTFFDVDGNQVDAAILTNGNCIAAMPPTQSLAFSRPVRSILIEAPAGSGVYVDTLHVNP